MLCEYGCGREAKFTLKNGKHCCESSSNKCPEVKRRNKEGIKKAQAEGRGAQFTWNGTSKNKEALKKGTENRVQKQIEEAFVEYSKASNESINNFLINYLHWPWRCSKCGLEEWQGQKIPLEIHHINGNSSDNRLENLQYLCLNCHAITDNFRGRNINTGKIKVTDEELKSALKENSSVRAALISVGLAPKGGNYSRAYKLLKDL